jgi:hypothetical protein
MADSETKFLTVESIENSVFPIFELPLPPEPSMTLLNEARNSLLLLIDSICWDGAGGEGFEEDLDKAVKKLIEISIARQARIGQLSQTDADAYEKYSSIIFDTYGKAHDSGAPETAPPFAYRYTPDTIAHDAQTIFHNLLRISGLNPTDTQDIRAPALAIATECVIKVSRDGRAPTDDERREALQQIRQIVDRAAQLVDTPGKPRDPAPKSRKPRA